jgi:hypothetical protein
MRFYCAIEYIIFKFARLDLLADKSLVNEELLKR